MVGINNIIHNFLSHLSPNSATKFEKHKAALPLGFGHYSLTHTGHNIDFWFIAEHTITQHSLDKALHRKFHSLASSQENNGLFASTRRPGGCSSAARRERVLYSGRTASSLFLQWSEENGSGCLLHLGRGGHHHGCVIVCEV